MFLSKEDDPQGKWSGLAHRQPTRPFLVTVPESGRILFQFNIGVPGRCRAIIEIHKSFSGGRGTQYYHDRRDDYADVL